MGFCNKTWRNKGKFLYKKEEEMWHLILIARNNHYVFSRHQEKRVWQKSFSKKSVVSECGNITVLLFVNDSGLYSSIFIKGRHCLHEKQQKLNGSMQRQTFLQLLMFNSRFGVHNYDTAQFTFILVRGVLEKLHFVQIDQKLDSYSQTVHHWAISRPASTSKSI